MRVHLHRIDRKMSEVLADVAGSLSGETITLRELLERIGEQGLLMICVFLALPFLFPVSIPGVSIVFGLLVALIAVGIVADRMPWLPRRLLNRRLSSERVKRLMERGARLFSRIERLVRPRLLVMTSGTVMSRVNGVALLAGGLLLMMPLGLVPFTNTLPGVAVVFLSAGVMQRDGLLILAGYAATLATVGYFCGLAVGLWLAGAGIHSLLLRGYSILGGR